MDFGKWMKFPSTIPVRSSKGCNCPVHHEDDQKLIEKCSLDPRSTYFLDSDAPVDLLPSIEMMKKFIINKKEEPPFSSHTTPTKLSILPEDENAFYFTVDMPGLSKEDDIKADLFKYVDGYKVVIEGRKSNGEGDGGDCNWHYYKSIKLDFVPKQIAGTMEDGVLSVTIFKGEKIEDGPMVKLIPK